MRRMTRRHLVSVLVLPAAILAGLLIFAWYRHSRLYTVTVLPRLGIRVVEPRALNDDGQIVGVCQGRFYLWERGKDWRELGPASDRLCINNAGQIAGMIEDPNGGLHAFLRDPNEGLTMLRVSGDSQSVALALNSRGQIVGRCWGAPGEGLVFLWTKTEGMRVVSSLDGTPQAMNDAGQIVACRGDMEPWQPILWEPTEDGSMTETLLPSGAFYDINNNGYVLGKAFNFDRRKYYAFIWQQDRGVEWLFPLENQMARVAALNDANQVAVCEEGSSGWFQRLTGWRFGLHKESFVWTPGRGRVFLDGYVMRRRGEYLIIYGMNNRGCIIGTIGLPDRSEGCRAVLLEPIPERWGR